MSVKQTIKFKEQKRLKPSEINANYGNLPKNINSYIDESVMAKQPEIDLWDFMNTRPDKLYEEWAYEVGSDLQPNTRQNQSLDWTSTKRTSFSS